MEASTNIRTFFPIHMEALAVEKTMFLADANYIVHKESLDKCPWK